MCQCSVMHKRDLDKAGKAIQPAVIPCLPGVILDVYTYTCDFSLAIAQKHSRENKEPRNNKKTKNNKNIDFSVDVVQLVARNVISQ